MASFVTTNVTLASINSESLLDSYHRILEVVWNERRKWYQGGVLSFIVTQWKTGCLKIQMMDSRETINRTPTA